MRMMLAFSVLLLATACDDSKPVADMTPVATDMSVAIDMNVSMPDMSTPGTPCGPMSCLGADPICCVTQGGGGDGGTSVSAACTTKTGCASTPGGIPVECDGPEECGGKPCCGSLSVTSSGGGLGAGGVACQNTCVGNIPSSLTMGMGGTITAAFCHTNNDCAGLTGMALGFPLPFTSCCTAGGSAAQGRSVCLPSLANGMMGISCLE